jgi:hypothetical protein
MAEVQRRCQIATPETAAGWIQDRAAVVRQLDLSGTWESRRLSGGGTC